MADDFRKTPWTERQWEEFLRESELRAARFGELLETLLDHPNRDELIAREMGWKGDRDAPEFEASEAEEDEPDEEVLEEEQRKRSRLRALPAYSAGYQWGLRVYKALENLGGWPAELGEADLDEIASRAIEGCLSVAAKIAAGHALGDDDQSLCGNIVCCRRAAAFAQQGIEALEELLQRGRVPAKAIHPLVAEGQRVRLLVEE